MKNYPTSIEQRIKGETNTMTKHEIREVFSNYGIWLDPNMEGEYSNSKGYKCYVRVNERDGKWEVVRYLSTFYDLANCDYYIASKDIKNIVQLKEVLESIISLPEKIEKLLLEL